MVFDMGNAPTKDFSVQSKAAAGEVLSPGPNAESSFTTLRRAWRVRDDEVLSADDAAKTLFRFRRSQHVRDLKLIASLAIVILGIQFAVVIAFVLAEPMIRFLGEWYRQGWHEAAGFVTPLKVATLFSSLLIALASYFAPAVPVLGGVMAWAYLAAATRLGVVDLFACEIRTVAASAQLSTSDSIMSRYIGTDLRRATRAFR